MAWFQAVEDKGNENGPQWSQDYSQPEAFEEQPANDQSFSDVLREHGRNFITGTAESTPTGLLGLPSDLAALLSLGLPKGHEVKGIFPSTHQLESMLGYEQDENLPTSRQWGRRFGRNLGPTGLFALLGGAPAVVGRLGQAVRQSFLGSSAGQAAKELGGGPWTQLAAELAGGWAATSPRAKAPSTSAHPKVAQHVNETKRIGLSEGTRKIVRMGAEDETKYAKAAAGSREAEKAIEKAEREVSSKLDTMKDTYIQNYASSAKDPRGLIKADMQRVRRTVERSLDRVPVTDATDLIHGNEQIIKSMKNKVSLEPIEKSLIKKLESQNIDYAKGLDLNGQPLTAGSLMRQYVSNNQTFHNFDDRLVAKQFHAQQENLQHAMTKANPRSGRLFEQSNRLYEKYLDTNTVLDKLEGLVDNDGLVNYKNLATDLDKPKVRELIVKVMGDKGLKDLTTLTEASTHVGEIKKAFASAQQKGIFEKVGMSGLAGGMASLIAGATGPWSAVGAASPYLTGKVRQRLATKMLTDPEFQGLSAEFYRHMAKGDWKQTVHALNKLEPLIKREEQREHEVGHFED